jgi:hypothetical protein
METLRIDRCLGSNNSSIVTLTEVSTVTTKGSLSSNARTYRRRNTFTHTRYNIYDIFVECLDIFFFPLYLYEFCCVSCTPMCVSRIQYVIRIFRVTIIIPDCLFVLFISSLKRSARLPYVFQWKIHTFHLVHATFFCIYLFSVEVLRCFVLCFLFGMLFLFVLLKTFCDCLCFFSAVCKKYPISFLDVADLFFLCLVLF